MTPNQISDRVLRELAIPCSGLLLIAAARELGLIRPTQGPVVDVEWSMEVVAAARNHGVEPTLDQAFTEAARAMAEWQQTPTRGATP